MPVRLVLQRRQIIRRKATVRKLDDLHRGVRPVRPSAVSSRRARAQRVHPWRLPWRPHAYRAALRVSPASKFSERYPSFPPNFTTFGHFLQPTTTWIVLTKPSSALLCKKILAPSKVGLNRKRSDFLDLPNGLWIHLTKVRSRKEKFVCKEGCPQELSCGYSRTCAFFCTSSPGFYENCNVRFAKRP